MIPPMEAIGSVDIPEGILRSQDAFFRDLPELLKDETFAASGSSTTAMSGSASHQATPLIQECNRAWPEE